MDTHYIIYASVPTRCLNDVELNSLLSTSRLENEKHLVTGMLVCLPETYIQLIEGPEEAIKNLYQNIMKDSRHRQVTTLKQGQSTNRFFPEWSMGYDQDIYSLADTLNTFDIGDNNLFKLLGILDSV